MEKAIANRSVVFGVGRLYRGNKREAYVLTDGTLLLIRDERHTTMLHLADTDTAIRLARRWLSW